MLGMGYIILLWHSLSLPYNYIAITKGVSTVGVERANMSAIVYL